MAYKFEIVKDKAGEFRVRFKYNSEVMFSTEGYASKSGAKDAIESIKKNAPNVISTAVATGATSRTRRRVSSSARLDQIDSSHTHSSSEPSCEDQAAVAL